MWRLCLFLLLLIASANNLRQLLLPAAKRASPLVDARTSAREHARALSLLRIETLSPGEQDARHAQEGDTATIQFAAHLLDQRETIVRSGKPFTFALGRARVIEGLWRGVVGAQRGERRRVTIPPELAYRDQGLGTLIPKNATLVYDITVLDVLDEGDARARAAGTPRTATYQYEQFDPDYIP